MRRAFVPLVLTAVVVSLSACSDGEATKTAPPEAAALPPGRPAIYAAQPEGPEPFVRALYAVYGAGGPKDATPPRGQDPIFSRQMNAVMGADIRLAKDEAPEIDFDPICGCQDQGAFTLDSLAITQSGVNVAEAAVAFTNDGGIRRQTLKLVREGVNWKVEDVVGADGVSLQATTLQSIVKRGG